MEREGGKYFSFFLQVSYDLIFFLVWGDFCDELYKNKNRVFNFYCIVKVYRGIQQVLLFIRVLSGLVFC